MTLLVPLIPPTRRTIPPMLWLPAFAFAVLYSLPVAMAEQPQSDEPPVIPVGLDAYRMWDRLPQHRIGCRSLNDE